MVHLSDISWDERGEDVIQNFRKGDMVKAAVTEIDVEKERISLSIKALGGDKFAEATGNVKRGSVITVEIKSIEEGGIEVEYEGMKSFIRKSDLSRDRAEQRPERFSVGDKVDVRVTNIDNKTRKLGVSIKAREIAEEKEAVEQYGSSDSGASLGDILGAALKTDDWFYNLPLNSSLTQFRKLKEAIKYPEKIKVGKNMITLFNPGYPLYWENEILAW